MRAEFMRLEDGEYIELEDVLEVFLGGKYYWLSFEKVEPYKLRTDEFRLVSIEA